MNEALPKLPHKFKISATSLEVAFLKAREWVKDNANSGPPDYNDLRPVTLHFIGAETDIGHRDYDEGWEYEFEIRKR